MRYMGSLHSLCFLQKKQLLQLHFRSKLGQASYMFYVSHPILKGCHCSIFKIFLQIVGLKGWRSIAMLIVITSSYTLRDPYPPVPTQMPVVGYLKKTHQIARVSFTLKSLLGDSQVHTKPPDFTSFFHHSRICSGPSVGHANTSPPMLLKTWLLKSEV